MKTFGGADRMRLVEPLQSSAIRFAARWLTLVTHVLNDSQFMENLMHDIVDTAVAAGTFKTLVAAVGAAELVETLKGDGPFTVFAPTDDAFSKLPEGTVESLILPENKSKLVEILTHHVVAGRVTAADVKGLKEATTVAGKTVAITVDNGAVKIDDATVVTADVECTNGLIHIVDAVILPK